jgi:hypothetical protein
MLEWVVSDKRWKKGVPTNLEVRGDQEDFGKRDERERRS